MDSATRPRVAEHVTEQRHTRLAWPLWLLSVLLIVEAAAATFSAFVERVWPAWARPQAAEWGTVVALGVTRAISLCPGCDER